MRVFIKIVLYEDKLFKCADKTEEWQEKTCYRLGKDLI